MLRFIASFFIAFCIPSLCLAQAERYELGRRLRLFEDAWEAQKDETKKIEPAATMNTAVKSFFALQFGEAARALDQGLLTLQGMDQRHLKQHLKSYTNLRCLWLKAESRWLELGTKKLKVKVDRFYSLKDPQFSEVGYQYHWISYNEARKYKLPDYISGPKFTVNIPGEIELNVPAEEGDYVLCLQWSVLEDRIERIHVKMFAVCISRKRDQRLAHLKEAVAQWKTPYASTDEVSVFLNSRLLTKLAQGETLETDYPADRLLKECEDACVAIAKKTPYYSTGKSGQFWIGVRTASKDIVPLRIQTAKAEPGKKVPVVLALHGAGGSENLFFDGYGNGKIAQQAAENGWFLVAPRSSLTKAGHAETIAELAKVFREIDTNRVFVIGHSMGAAEAIREANATPGKFAAVAALGGGGSPRPTKDQVEAFKALPFYVGIGENDFARSQAEALVKNLKKQGASDVTFKQYDGIEHMIIVQEALPEVFIFFEFVNRKKASSSK